MLKLHINEVLYASFKKQLCCSLVLIVLSGFIVYKLILTPLLVDLKAEKNKQQQLLLKKQYTQDLLAEQVGGAIKPARLSALLQIIAQNNNVALRLSFLGKGCAELKIQATYSNLFAFLQALLEIEELMVVEKISIEKNKNIKSKIIIKFLEAGDA
jgi:hypothetical protein